MISNCPVALGAKQAQLKTAMLSSKFNNCLISSTQYLTQSSCNTGEGFQDSTLCYPSIVNMASYYELSLIALGSQDDGYPHTTEHADLVPSPCTEIYPLNPTLLGYKNCLAWRTWPSACPKALRAFPEEQSGIHIPQDYHASASSFAASSKDTSIRN